MKKSKLLFALLTVTFCSCANQMADKFKFGIAFNSERQKFGVPLLKKNMSAYECCKEPTIYRINKIPNSNTAYHSSKTIESFSDSTLFEEADIYRKNIDDSTIFNLKMLSLWNLSKNKVSFEGVVGKIDKREMKLTASNYLIEKKNAFPKYNSIDIDISGIDSVLHSWGLSRFDQE